MSANLNLELDELEAVRRELVLATGARELEEDESREEQAQRMELLVSVIGKIDDPGTSHYERLREASMHERHVDLMAHCRLCRIEAGDQPDRLTPSSIADRLPGEPIPLNPDLCPHCGLELDPGQPFDGHRDCREQE